MHDHIEQDEDVQKIWADAEVFDPKTERLFRYLQVFTACAMSFAHGSNDVANAMGPFAAVYQTWSTGKVPGKSTGVPIWILAVGGAGIVTGLATYGYKARAGGGRGERRAAGLGRGWGAHGESASHSSFPHPLPPPPLYPLQIMAVLAVKSVKLTNARGFCVELASAMTVVLASRFGLPISTTQVACGAVLSMGLMEGGRGVNWRMAGRIAVGWVLTLVIACGVCCGFTAFGVYTPSKSAAMAAAAAAKSG